MEYRQLGTSGLRVSTVAMGTMTFGGVGDFRVADTTDAAGARQLVDQCLDAGVNLIDTADMYSGGVSEEIVGEVLEGRRDRVLIATKVRAKMGDGPNDAGLSRHHLISACEASLRRLRTDHIDLYQLHGWDGQTPLEEILGALDSLITAGKVRYVGCSNFSAWHVMKALGVAQRDHLPRFACQQIYYSLQSRDVEYELIPVSVDQGLGVLVWSPLAGGLLTGKYRRDHDAPEGSRHLNGWGEPPIRDQEALYDLIELLVAVAAEAGAEPAQVALAWLLRRPAVTSVVIGARSPTQLAANLAAADLKLDDKLAGRLDAATAPTLLYPYWHQVQDVTDRLSPADKTLLGSYL
jgi:aryl-alcohol dehydrogenase-like predicted oxidoreductase